MCSLTLECVLSRAWVRLRACAYTQRNVGPGISHNSAKVLPRAYASTRIARITVNVCVCVCVCVCERARGCTQIRKHALVHHACLKNQYICTHSWLCMRDCAASTRTHRARALHVPLRLHAAMVAVHRELPRPDAAHGDSGACQRERVCSHAHDARARAHR